MQLSEPSLTPETDIAGPPAPANGDAVAGSEAGEASGSVALQFISFTIGEAEYGVDIMAVREIKGWTDITKLPNTPPYMRGVLNLRGVIVPIFDLRCRFGQGLTEATALHVVVIVAVADRIVGILVDAVSDILTVNSEEIRPVPELEAQRDQDFLKGLATTAGERMVAILALDKLISDADLSSAEAC